MINYNNFNKIKYNYILLIKEYEIVLADVKNNTTLAYLSIGEYSDKTLHIVSVGAEKGLGTTIYEYALMNYYPNYFIPSRDGDVSGNAFNIWKKFFNRKDIEKIVNDDIFSNDFLFSLITGEDTHYTNVDKKELIEFWNETDNYTNYINDLIIFNSKYRLKPNEDFYKYKKIGDDYMLNHDYLHFFDVDYSSYF